MRCLTRPSANNQHHRQMDISKLNLKQINKIIETQFKYHLDNLITCNFQIKLIQHEIMSDPRNYRFEKGELFLNGEPIEHRMSIREIELLNDAKKEAYLALNK
jgi:hypothetical protein